MAHLSGIIIRPELHSRNVGRTGPHRATTAPRCCHVLAEGINREVQACFCGSSTEHLRGHRAGATWAVSSLKDRPGWHLLPNHSGCGQNSFPHGSESEGQASHQPLMGCCLVVLGTQVCPPAQVALLQTLSQRDISLLQARRRLHPLRGPRPFGKASL